MLKALTTKDNSTLQTGDETDETSMYQSGLSSFVSGILSMSFYLQFHDIHDNIPPYCKSEEHCQVDLARIDSHALASKHRVKYCLHQHRPH